MPAPFTPRGHFVSLVQNVRWCARWKNMEGLQNYLASDRFADAMRALDGVWRPHAVRSMTEALVVCANPKARARKPPPPRRSIKWDEATKARFRRAYLAGGLPAAAKAVGISREAARLAAKRHVPGYVPASATQQLAKAA